MFDIDYTKMERDVSSILPTSVLDLVNIQNYMPLYDKFFKLNKDNFNTIHLNNEQNLIKLVEKKVIIFIKQRLNQKI